LKSENIFHYNQVFKAYVKTRDPSFQNRDLSTLKSEFASLMSYSSKVLTFTVAEERYVKFIIDNSGAILNNQKSLDSMDLAIASLKQAIESCKKGHQLASKGTAKVGNEWKKKYLLKMRNALHLLNKINDLEINQHLFEANKLTSKAIKEAVPDYDEIVKTMDDLAEAISDANELDNILSENINNDASTEDEDLNAELDKLMEEFDQSEVQKEKMKSEPISNSIQTEENVQEEKEEMLSERTKRPDILFA
jgi:hypothetical protein